MGYMYKLTNKVNGKSYIGQTIRPIHIRLEEHRTGKSIGCRAIYNAIQFYGWDAFDIDWYYCPDEDLNKHEKWMVNLMGTLAPGGYNLKEGGGSGGKYSDETKQKMSEAQLGKKQNEEHRQKRREAQLGEKNHRYGKTLSDDHKQKMSEALRGEKHPRSKRIYQYELNGTFIDSFESTEEAGRYLKKECSSIGKCARGRRKTAYNFKWSFTMDIFM
jgi:group I intron endonuclease